MKEYDRFEKGAANGNTSTQVLQRQLEDRDAKGNPHTYKKMCIRDRLMLCAGVQNLAPPIL